jgi:hypothetical protein
LTKLKRTFFRIDSFLLFLVSITSSNLLCFLLQDGVGVLGSTIFGPMSTCLSESFSNWHSYRSYEEDTSDQQKKISETLCMENEWKMFKSSDGTDYGVSTSASGEAVLIVHHDVSYEMLEISAYAASATAEIETFVESASISQKMKVASIIRENIPEAAEAITAIDTLEDSVEQIFEMECVCS